MTNGTPHGILGLVGREPIAAALTVSIKGANGAPTEKDRFHVLDATPGQREYAKRDGGTYKAPARDPHPAFGAFNKAEVVRRRMIPARLCHVTVREMFEFRLQCGKARGIPEHPKKGPVCIGNGQRAQRWNGNDYTDIRCPGERCEFSKPGPPFNGRPTKPPCGPWMRFLARFDWPETDGKRLPNLPFKFTSGGWNSTKEFVGFFGAFERACQGFGVDPNDVPLFGMPIQLTMAERTNADTQSRYPVVSIGMAGDADLIAWIGGQLERRQDIRRLAAAYHVPALTDHEQQSAEVLAVDAEIVGGPGLSVPSGK